MLSEERISLGRGWKVSVYARCERRANRPQKVPGLCVSRVPVTPSIFLSNFFNLFSNVQAPTLPEVTHSGSYP